MRLRALIEGFGLAFMLVPPPRRKRPTDAEAIAGDWQKVGEDRRKAMPR